MAERCGFEGKGCTPELLSSTEGVGSPCKWISSCSWVPVPHSPSKAAFSKADPVFPKASSLCCELRRKRIDVRLLPEAEEGAATQGLSGE